MMQKNIVAQNKEHLKEIIQKTIGLKGNNCDLNFIDTSQITNMNFLFVRSSFNGDISKWDTSNVENMSSMFFASQFNGNISGWNTKSVIDMRSMFAHSKFNGDISKWNTKSVINMDMMFFNSQFNGDISNWNIENLEGIYLMFSSSNANNIPYWAEIADNIERQQAYIRHKAEKEKNIINNEISKVILENNSKTIFKI